MFFTFPEDARWNAEQQAVEFGSRSASTAVWPGSRGACSNAYCLNGHPRAVRRSVLSPASPVGDHRRAEVTPSPVDRGQQRRDQRAGFALGARWGPCRHATERPKSTLRGQSMTSSARASTEGGTVRPSACAVLRLTTSSKVVAAAPAGRPGFLPSKSVPRKCRPGGRGLCCQFHN
jgi:hypothetical protein